MKSLNRMIATAICMCVASCGILRDGESMPVSAGAVADLVELYRQDVAELAPLASPDTQERLAKLDFEAKKVIAALRLVDSGGPIDSLEAAASAAVIVAEQVISELEADGRDVRDLRFFLATVRIAFRHMQIGNIDQAGEALESQATTN